MTQARELSLFVVGIDHPNPDGSNRRFNLALCRPGEPVELRPEPKNKHDSTAVAVFSERGEQLGYLSAERCGWISSKLGLGETYEAVFQDLRAAAAVIRVRFGGGSPSLPTPAPSSAPANPDFYPDPDGPDWGA